MTDTSTTDALTRAERRTMRAASRYATEHRTAAADLVPHLTPGAASLVFRGDEHADRGDCIELIHVRANDGTLLWYAAPSEYAHRADARALGTPPDLNDEVRLELERCLDEAFYAAPWLFASSDDGHYELPYLDLYELTASPPTAATQNGTGAVVTVEVTGRRTYRAVIGDDNTATITVNGTSLLGVDADGPGYWLDGRWRRLTAAGEPGDERADAALLAHGRRDSAS